DREIAGNQQFIEVCVKDNGIGMNAIKIESLFRKDKIISTTGTNHETGTGFGLILCKEFIEKHEGKIWVESQPGEGSCFAFTLPKA
ncbi:MAG: sensor histidine kinase, partial [Bacteroidia bacterium]